MAATNPIAMSPHDHAAQALTILSQSKKEFEANDIFQGSEKLWGAACHALFAAVGQSGGRSPQIPCRHQEESRAARQGPE